MKRILRTITILLTFGILTAPVVLADSSALSTRLDQIAEGYAKDVATLASDEMEGRGLETEGIKKAASWIEDRLRTIGLTPAFDGSYRQPFGVKTGVSMQPGNVVEGLGEEDWAPLGFSSSGEFSGELVFAGYGIDAEPLGYQELSGLDLNGKIVMILRYEPQERDDASAFSGRKPSRWSALRYKVLQIRERGTAAIVFVTGPLQDEGSDKVPPLRNDGPESPAGIPVFQVRTSVAQKWLSPAGIDLEAFQKQVDRDLVPRSQAIPDTRITGRINLEATYADTENLVGILPGKGSLKDEIVVIGAHYDHLGYGGRASMRPNEQAIHNGADDNASGTVAVLQAAARIRELLAGSDNHRTVVIALFSAEEVGLAGSAFLVDHTPFDMTRVVAMLNLDMVGRLRDNRLTVFGTDSAKEWSEPLSEVAKELEIEITSRGDGYGPSDQSSFFGKQIAVLHFFTGTHEEYHSPEDDAATINSQGAARIVELTTRMGEKIASGSLNPIYVRTTSAPVAEGDSRGYGAYLGTVPDFSSMESTEGGVLLSDVRKGGPADLAGIRGGDRIVKMAGTRIENLYDMTFALQDHKPGETINVVVVRDGSEMALRATLGDRARRSEPPPQPPGPDGGKVPPPVAPSPHAMPMPQPSTESEVFKLPEFYMNRPGKSFEIRAGKPFDRAFESETHFTDIRQLTSGGENAEAYFSPDGTKLIYQVTKESGGCDQQFILDLATGETTLVSTGKGRTTCGYFDWPEADRIIYSSTESSGEECPPSPDYSKGYVWATYKSYEIYEATLDGRNVRRLTDSPGYDAEATWCHRGGRMIFTSDRDGDLDLYEMDEAGNVRRITNTPGYDGGAFYNADCTEIVWRASRPAGEALADYQRLLEMGLIRPSSLEIQVMNADGTNVRQLTNNGAANFGPYFHPDGKRVIFASNAGTGDPREFELFMVDTSGGEPVQITFSEGFDGFPMFSPDGEWFVWASNRADVENRETNIFIARWVD